MITIGFRNGMLYSIGYVRVVAFSIDEGQMTRVCEEDGMHYQQGSANQSSDMESRLLPSAMVM